MAHRRAHSPRWPTTRLAIARCFSAASRAEIGSTTTRVPGRAFNYEAVSAAPLGTLANGGDATLTRWTVSGILGSNYSFLE